MAVLLDLQMLSVCLVRKREDVCLVSVSHGRCHHKGGIQRELLLRSIAIQARLLSEESIVLQRLGVLLLVKCNQLRIEAELLIIW